MNSPKPSEKTRSQSLKRPSLPSSQSTSQEILTEDDSSTSQILDRVKPDRVASTKPEEDRRRRTIIVEKQKGTYGFTLQSYGIHYKREQEIEMITYVDYVGYDGPAYKAGMREGDVILSINGHDMEKADHKTLVNFIKNCDTRMRMVVLFEDCVRKVELHIRYIQVQRMLQSKTAELDRLCLREKELLQGKWKTHSLPARKKGNGQQDAVVEEYCRPTVSTENVAQPQQQVLLAYQYVDPRYQYVLQSKSSEYLLTWQQNDKTPVLVKTNPETARRYSARGYHQTNGVAAAEQEAAKTRGKSKSHHHTRQLCTPCIQNNNNQDNNSLEAYDLASPCCEPHCVPSARRRARSHKHKHEHHQEGHKENQSQVRHHVRETGSGHHARPPQSHRSHKYFNFGSNLVSQCSLHSCTSSEASAAVGGVERRGESSAASYTTSLSTDTLYWDENHSRQHSTKSHSSNRHSSKTQLVDITDGFAYNPVKPKSWDNLTTKAFGGYGFGYGYLDTGTSAKSVGCSSSSGVSSSASNTLPSNSKSTGQRIHTAKVNFKGIKTDGRIHGVQIYHGGHHYYVPPTKSSESLLLLPKQDSTLSDSSLSCDCLDISSPGHVDNMQRFFPTATVHVGRESVETVFYQRDMTSQTEAKQRRALEQAQGTEVTRL